MSGGRGVSGVLGGGTSTGKGKVGGPSISARRDRKIQKEWKDCYRELDLEGKIGTHREGREGHAKQKEQQEQRQDQEFGDESR